MPVHFRPKNYHAVTPYVMAGDAQAMMDFITAAFGAETFEVMKGEDGRVMHAEMRIDDSMMMIAGANPPAWPSQPASFYLYVEDADAVYKKAIAAGATSIMEPADQFYGDRHGGVKDSNGNSWWIATHIEDVPKDELKRRMEKWEQEKAAAA